MNKATTPEQPVRYTGLSLKDYAGLPELITGVAVTSGAMVLGEKILPAWDRKEATKDLDSEIHYIERDQEDLRESQEILDQSGDTSTSTGIGNLITAKDNQIAEIRTQKDEIGYDTMDTAQTLFIPLALGVIAAGYAVKRIHFPKKSQ